MTHPRFAIPYYHDYLSPELAAHLLKQAQPVAGVPGLAQVGPGGGLETTEALRFLADLYRELEPGLARVLAQRIRDRKFLDDRVRACETFNRELGRDWVDPEYRTVLGLEDADGRVVIGPKSADYCQARAGAPIAPLPEFLKGPHVTLFGPPDTAKMAINAMNAYHRQLPGEPPIVAELLNSLAASPMWGADDEDSKTPLRADLVDAAVNLTGCFEGTIRLEEKGKTYELATDHLALPIKRFPGLALPSPFLFVDGNPVPLHLYDFALHLFRNWHNPRALVFYVPKLENEEEAAYIHEMIACAEARIQALHPEYKPGTVRLMIVLENPRAILRAHEIIDALHPYFAGASLGWHDYLASTARLFKNDRNYRIPVKADPGIVIKYIKASHLLLADAVGSRGGIKVGGMYGILPLQGSAESLQVTLKGFFKDVITQLKRDLTGFWVAHPDFVRIGLAIVAAWQRHSGGDREPLRALVRGLLEGSHRDDVLRFIDGSDIQGLDPADPNYVRSLIVADIKESDFIANNHPDEIRYNVFQSLQYLTDWLCGNGCVALPTIVDGVPVRVMDDLATAERSRWEVWHELHHGRFPLEDFIRIAHEEMNFIRRDLSDGKKIVQVKWDERTARWYPVAYRLMLQLMTSENPAEFATELLLPFTLDEVRGAEDPWAKVRELAPGKYLLEKHVADLDHYFEICGSLRFARAMAANAVEEAQLGQQIVLGFTQEEVIEAASFHGDIGQSRATLDQRAAREQAGVSGAEAETIRELRELGQAYREKFGFKFLISAQGRSAAELLAELRRRSELSAEEELQHAREALWEISRKRLAASPRDQVRAALEKLREAYGITGVSIALNYLGATQALCFGESERGRQLVRPRTAFEIASLSKTFAAAFTAEYFRSHGISLDTPVNQLFGLTSSEFRLRSPANPEWAERVTVTHLLNHSALNMHYVRGIAADAPMPDVGDLLEGNAALGYDAITVLGEPGKAFHYSGGGFLVLEHLLEALANQPVSELTRPFLENLGVTDFSFAHDGPSAHGYLDDGRAVPGGRLHFPAFAAGAFASATDVALFLRQLAEAHHDPAGSGPISHDTAVTMLHGTDRGCREFMAADMGLGVFTTEAGANRLALHQGANEGFRALYLQCYAGPDRGKGLVILANGDNAAVPFVAEAASILLDALVLGGRDSLRAAKFDARGVPQEQIVNQGYRTLLFRSFHPDLPEAVETKGPLDPLSSFNLAVGARLLEVTNQKFARAENLVSPHVPLFDPELFGRQGKIMDSWESARHNPEPFDRAVFALARPAPIRFLSLDTKFHDGNQAEFVRVEGFAGGEWREILPKTAMAGHSLLRAELASHDFVYDKFRVDIFPDGGLSRIGLFEDLPEEVRAQFTRDPRPVRHPDVIPKTRKPLALPYEPSAAEIDRNRARGPSRETNHASRALGATLSRASNEHYGPAVQVLSPFPPLHMFDGLESARSRKPGHHEEVVVKFAAAIRPTRVGLDFTYFVNNNPSSVSLHGRYGADDWRDLTGEVPVKAFAGNWKELDLGAPAPITELMVRTYPDGGINRIKVFVD